jgi:hypothetical protein
MDASQRGEIASYQVKELLATFGGPASLPSVPGIYWFTSDLGVACETMGTEAGLNSIGVDRGRIFRNQRLEPFLTIDYSLDPPPLGRERLRGLQELLETEERLGEAIIAWASVLARPLYVGITIDIHRRFVEHQQSNSYLRQYLDEVGIDLFNCRFSFLTFPPNDVELVQVSDETFNSFSSLQLMESLMIRTCGPLLNRRRE